jgi:ubiquitin-protein ligase
LLLLLLLLLLSSVICNAQELLDTPNLHSPAQMPAYQSYTKERAAYTQRIRKQAAQYPPLD